MPNEASPPPRKRTKKPRIWRIRDGARLACRRLVRERDSARAELARLLSSRDTEPPPPTEAASSAPAASDADLEAVRDWIAWVAWEYCAENKTAEHALLILVPDTAEHETSLAMGHVSSRGIPTAEILENKPGRAELIRRLASSADRNDHTWKRLAIKAIEAHEPGAAPLRAELARLRDQLDAYRSTIGAVRENLEDLDGE